MPIGTPAGRHYGDMRFGSTGNETASGEVTTRKMTQEEIQKYYGGGKNVHTKTEYLSLKDEKMSDAKIQEKWGIDNNRLYKLKKQWGVIGQFGPGKKQEKPETPHVSDNQPKVKRIASVGKEPNHVVDSPSHYTRGGIETIEYMQAKLTREQFEGYLAGNVLKYTSRYRFKNGVEDLEKSRWYLNKLISVLPGGK